MQAPGELERMLCGTAVLRVGGACLQALPGWSPEACRRWLSRTMMALGEVECLSVK